MTLRRAFRSTRLRVSGALVLLLVPVLTSGFSTAHAPLVTGHSTFFNGDNYDPCLASIVGVMRLRVMWFNDMVLVDRYNGEGSYIYAVEHGAPDPRDQNLVDSGVFYDFVDPNGVQWHVEEAYWDHTVRWNNGGEVGDGGTLAWTPVTGGVTADAQTLRYYTWIVKVGKAVKDHFAGDDPHDFYNFVNVVDTCKMHRNEDTFAGPVNHTMSGANPPGGHPEGETRDHKHESFNVDLWVGKEPRIIPLGEEVPNSATAAQSWAAQWTNEPGSGEEPASSPGST